VVANKAEPSSRPHPDHPEHLVWELARTAAARLTRRRCNSCGSARPPFSVFVDDGLKQSPQHSHFDPQVT